MAKTSHVLRSTKKGNMVGERRSGNAFSEAPLSIERRMELLESRFTTPSTNHMPAPSSPPDNTNVPASNQSMSPAWSRHSYNFDAPASRSSSGSSHLSNASNIDKSRIRSKRKSPRTRSSLDDVQLAAKIHMQKVMNASPLNGMTSLDTSSKSVLSSPQLSDLSMSNQTLLTSHVKYPTQHAKVVAESPPTLTSPALNGMQSAEAQKRQALKSSHSTVSSSYICHLQMSTFSVLTSSNVHHFQTDKRKSVPMKRPLPSVTEKPMTNPSNMSVTPGSSSGRKRTRLNFTEPQQISPGPKAMPLDISSLSRDRSNPATMLKKAKAPTNNTLINDFFSVANHKAMKLRLHPIASCAVETRSQARLAAAAAATATTTAVSPPDTQDKWQQRCQELEQLFLDRNEQLKAVSNNQTIMHTALRQSVYRLEQEVESMNKSKTTYELQTATVIEKLVRSESAREAKELRDILASDGARLGRIVYTRAGMRAVESWEDGYAFKALKSRSIEIEIRREALTKRQEDAKRAAKELEQKKNGGDEFGTLVVMDALGVMEAQESSDVHMEAVKRQEIALTEEEQALNDEKANHIRAWKRLQSEEESRFRSRPRVSFLRRCAKLLLVVFTHLCPHNRPASQPLRLAITLGERWIL